MSGLMKKSILSGILVGIGVVINTKVSNQYIGAMLFSVALLVIIKCKLNLYTGKIGYIKDNYVDELFFMLMGNLIGVLLPVFIGYGKESGNTFEYIASVKFSKECYKLFLDGVMCGMLMFIAVHCKTQLITVFCIMTFILSGYEHCIASFPYLILNFNIQNVFKFLCIVTGNSIGSIMTNKLIGSGGVNI